MFQDELIVPGNFETVAHAAQYLQLRAEDIWQARWDNSTKGFCFSTCGHHRHCDATGPGLCKDAGTNRARQLPLPSSPHWEGRHV
jgi:hypothetical protein